MRISTTMMALIIAMMMVAGIMPLGLKGGQVTASSSVDEPNYTSHAPIRINSDAEFAALAASDPNVNGTGSALDPFTIEDLNISGAGAGTALYIGNVSSSFIVRNSSFILASGNGNEYFWNSGVVLHNATHGTIEYNKVYSNTNHGICVDISSRLTLKWNQIYSNTGNGIDLFTSTQITMSNNTIHHNANGIRVVNGLFDDFSTATRYWSYYGSAYRSMNDVVLTDGFGQAGVMWFKSQVYVPMSMTFRFIIGGGNGADGMVAMFNKDRNYIPGGGSALGFTETDTNPVAGYGVEFDEYPHSAWDPTINPHVGLIQGIASNHLYYADDSRIGDGAPHDAKIEVLDSMGMLTIDNSPSLSVGPISFDRTYGGLGFSGATGGLWNIHRMDDVSLQFNESNMIIGNIIHNNSAGGIDLHKANHDIVMNNTVRYNDVGIELMEGSTKVNVVMNNVSRSNHEGILIDNGNNNTLKDNNVSYNNQDAGQQWNYAGVKFSNSENITMEHNYISHNPIYGIHVDQSDYNVLLSNQIVFNCGGVAGLYLTNADHNRIEWNNVSDGTGIGINLYYDNEDNYLANNTVNGNADTGIYTYNSKRNVLENNTVRENGNAGIAIYSSSSLIMVKYNNIEYNQHEGVLVQDSNNITLKHNNVSYNNQDTNQPWNHAGVKLYQSENITVKYNYVSHNPYYGVNIEQSKYNTLFDNQIVFNCGGNSGLVLFTSNHNRIIWNNISKGTGQGISIYSSSNDNYYANNTVNDNAGSGVYMDSSNRNVFENNTFLRNGGDGIRFYSSNSNIIRYNDISNNGNLGVYLWDSVKNRIYYNSFIDNVASGQAWDNMAGNYWNASDKGNYWSNYDTPGEGCFDTSPANGICDAAYPIPGAGSALDQLPVTSPQIPDVVDTSMFILTITLISFAFVAVRRRR